ncbi:4-hydroxy-tetrahydrodipicolinate synthase [Lachnospiraceae bacterium]|nr:4-hydroxy-tetrahydrodipicolinate synthase [Lachnospiraceae bacterium]GFI30317.1 4-hydroxy-tetrahydrodipicolinate synthase [Lachnospiraceae bacterium]
MAIFKGAGVALVTPMKDNLEVNYEKLEELLEDQIKNETDSIIITGTTGEASTLTVEEHLEVIRQAVSIVNKRIPVIAGTGSNCTKTAVELSYQAQLAGADGLLVVTPYYNKATQKGLFDHYMQVAKRVDLPIIMYNIPGRTGCRIEAGTAAALNREAENIVGMKDAVGDVSYTLKVMEETQGDFDMYSGEDGQVIPFLACGGIGVISVLSNIAPKFTHDMVMNYLNGSHTEALKMQLKALPLVDALFCEVNPIPVKAAMNLMGWQAGPLRAPLSQMEPENVKKLSKAMQEFGISLTE